MSQTARRHRLLNVILAAVGAGGCASTAIVACGSTTSDSVFDSGTGTPFADGSPSDGPLASDGGVRTGWDAFANPPFDASPVCTELSTSQTFIDPTLACGGGFDGSANYFARACFPLPDGATCEATYSSECVLSRYSCGLSQRGNGFCGPLPDRTDACCYDVFGDCFVGRPFTVGGTARLPSVNRDSVWASSHEGSVSDLEHRTG